MCARKHWYEAGIAEKKNKKTNKSSVKREHEERILQESENKGSAKLFQCLDEQ